MIGSLFGILIALFIVYHPIEIEKYAHLNILIPFFIATSLLLIFIENLAFSLSLAPLQKATKLITPHLLNRFQKDRLFRLINGWLIIFVLITLLIAMNISTVSLNNQNFLIAIWIALLGFSFDCLQYGLRHIMNYLNPFTVLEMFKKEGIKNIQNEHEIDLCNQIDAISETAIKGIENGTPFLTKDALNAIQNLARTFLESAKSISFQESDKQTEKLGIKDKVTYTLSYLLKRADFIFQKALDKKLETTLNSSITEMGKMTISAAKCDISLAIHPLIYLGKFGIKSVENKFQETGVLAICTLSEVAKEIIAGQDLTYLEIKEPFLCLIGQLENISKELFKQDKQMKIMILIEPFIEIKQLFESEKMMNHQDTEEIKKDLDRVIGEFQILENVMRTIPSNPTFNEKNK